MTTAHIGKAALSTRTIRMPIYAILTQVYRYPGSRCMVRVATLMRKYNVGSRNPRRYGEKMLENVEGTAKLWLLPGN